MAKNPPKQVFASITHNGDGDEDKFGPHKDGGSPRLSRSMVTR